VAKSIVIRTTEFDFVQTASVTAAPKAITIRAPSAITTAWLKAPKEDVLDYLIRGPFPIFVVG
jgi:hypothetical protein